MRRDEDSLGPVGLSRPPEPLGAERERQSAYASLLRDSRGLKRDQQLARESWFAGLAVDRKEEAFFELEILMKGLACFSNPRNHPGASRRTHTVSQDFRPALSVARDGMSRIVQLARHLLGERDKTFVFQRYLEVVLPEDTARTRLLAASLGQESPEASLFMLRHGMTNLIEVTTGVLRLPRVTFRVFYALLSSVMREIAHSSFFSPLAALEFRPEFDRISSGQVLELIHSVPGEHAHRLVALTFLSLFRVLRYLRLLDSISADYGDKRLAGRVHLVLAVVRSDLRALTGYLRTRSSGLLAESFERELLRVPAHEIASRENALRREAHRLLDIKGVLSGLSANLRLESRRAYEHDLPSVDADLGEAELRQRIRSAIGGLRPAIQNAILFLGKSLGARLEEGAVFDDAAARRATSERLRRDVWMFAQILRAFAVKARVADPISDDWTRLASFAFVREFLSYFRAMGYPLLRAGDYDRVGAFLTVMSALEDTDVIDASKLDLAIDECDSFYGFLIELFEHISQREELQGVPFERAVAARALRLYLGDRAS